MYKYLYLILLIVAISSSCDLRKYKLMEEENETLKSKVIEQDSSLVAFLNAFMDIEKNLAEIRQRELAISLVDEEFGLSEKEIQEKIEGHIEVIDSLLLYNKSVLNGVRAQLRTAKGKNLDLINKANEIEKSLNAQIDVKNQQVAKLKEDLQRMNMRMEELNAGITNLREENQQLKQLNQQKEETINKRTNELNTAYFVVADNKELREKNIIVKKGGFIGIGKTEVLSRRLNPNQFQKIDIRETATITFEAKKMEIVSTHPEGSYEVVMGDKLVQGLEILNPERFWLNSKFLVISIN